MSVAFIAERYSAAQGASSNDLVSGSFTPNADALLVLVMHVSDAITSISGHDGGGSWVQIGSTLDVSGRELHIYACHTGSSPSAGTVTIAIPYNWNIAVTLLEFTGVDVSGTVVQSFGTLVSEAVYDQRQTAVSPAAYSDVGNATLVAGLVGGGSVPPFTSDSINPDVWVTEIGGAAVNGGVSAGWFNYEPVGAVQAQVASWIWSGFAAVEIKAETPNTGFIRTVGNGTPAALLPEGINQQARLIQFSVPDGGTLGSVFAMVQHNDAQGATCCMYLYDASGNLLDQSNTVDAPGPNGSVNQLEFTGMTYELAASTTYYLGVASDETVGIRICASEPAAYFTGYEITSGFSNLATPPDPATLVVDGVYDFYIYAEYTPASGTTVVITDVNTTESWADGDTGLVITGSGFV